MSDGSFAVWDSLTSQTFASQRSGRHKHGIKAASWLPSLFAPALALGSLSNIKVSQGFEGTAWSATAMKLKRAGGRKKLTPARMSTMSGKEMGKEIMISGKEVISSAAETVKEVGKKLASPGSTPPPVPPRCSYGEGEGEGGDHHDETDLGTDLDFVTLGFSPSGKIVR